MMALLEVKNLQVRVEDREILHGLSLTVNKGEVHAIMGPNGSGKSTLSHVIAGKPGYEVTDGEILFRGENLLEMSPDERAEDGRDQRVGRPARVDLHPAHGREGDPFVRHDLGVEHGPENRIERLSKSAAVGELLARSFTPFYQPRFVDPVLALLDSMVESLPVYRFQFVPDRSAVETILEFHD
jgi:energy-coupling factor transporter ATP-binding protein EcfA2